MRQVISREVALTEVWLDEQACAMGSATIQETLAGMTWRHALTVVGLAGLVYGFLLFG